MPLDFETPEQKRLKQQAQTKQAATNSTPTSQMAQQRSQPAGGNFQPAAPEPVSPLKSLVGGLVGQKQGSAGAAQQPIATQGGDMAQLLSLQQTLGGNKNGSIDRSGSAPQQPTDSIAYNPYAMPGEAGYNPGKAQQDSRDQQAAGGIFNWVAQQGPSLQQGGDMASLNYDWTKGNGGLVAGGTNVGSGAGSPLQQAAQSGWQPTQPPSSTPAVDANKANGTLEDIGKRLGQQTGQQHQGPQSQPTPGTPVPGKPGFVYNEYGGYDTVAPPQPGAPAGPNGGNTPPPNANTDGYAMPGYVAPVTGAAPPGWEQDKWANASHQTPKYAVGRILAGFPPTVEGLQSAMGDIQKAYPGATLIGRDKVNIPGVGTIDVLQGSAQGGVAWQWGAEDAGGGQAPPPPPVNAPMTTQAPNLGPMTTTTPPPSVPPPTPVPPTPAPTVPGTGTTPPVQATYQSYNYNLPNVTPGQSPTMISPQTIGQYTAGTTPQYQPTDVSAQTGAAAALAGQAQGVTAPTYQPGQIAGYTPADTSAQTGAAAAIAGQAPQTVAPFAGGAGTDAFAQALAALQQMAPTVNASGQKEAAKETLLAGKDATTEALRRRAAQFGTSGSGALLGAEAQLGDAFAGDLTRNYRDIDAAAQQQTLQNLLAQSGAFSGLGSAMTGAAQGDYTTGLAGQALQGQLQNQAFGQNMDLASLLSSLGQNAYTTNLAGQQVAGQQQQAATSLGLQGDQLAAALQQQQFGQNMDLASLLQNIGQGNFASQLAGSQAAEGNQQAQAASGQAAANYGLNYDQLQQAAQNQAFQQQLAAAGLNLQGQQAQAGQVNAQNQFGLSNAQLLAQQLQQQQAQAQQNQQFYSNLGQQNAQFNAQLEQQAAQSAAQMGYNWAQLSQQDKQFLLNLQLQQAQAASEQNQAWWNTIMNGLG